MLVRVWRKATLYTIGGNASFCSHFGKQYRGSLINYKYTYHMTYNTTPGYVLYSKKPTNFTRYMYPNVHSNIVYNCQDVVAT